MWEENQGRVAIQMPTHPQTCKKRCSIGSYIPTSMTRHSYTKRCKVIDKNPFKDMESHRDAHTQNAWGRVLVWVCWSRYRIQISAATLQLKTSSLSGAAGVFFHIFFYQLPSCSNCQSSKLRAESGEGPQTQTLTSEYEFSSTWGGLGEAERKKSLSTLLPSMSVSVFCGEGDMRNVKEMQREWPWLYLKGKSGCSNEKGEVALQGELSLHGRVSKAGGSLGRGRGWEGLSPGSLVLPGIPQKSAQAVVYFYLPALEKWAWLREYYTLCHGKCHSIPLTAPFRSC